MGVDYHAWTHRPKAQGGTDPIDMPGEGGQWIRLSLTNVAEQNVTAGSSDIVLFDNVKNNYPAYFGTLDLSPGTTGEQCAVTILQAGIYAFTYRLYLGAVPTNTGFTTQMNGIDWDEFLYYEKYQPPSPILTGYGVHDSYVFRSGPTYGLATPPRLYVIVDNPVAADATININDTGGTGTYLEIVRLGDAAIVGNPDA